MNGRCRRCSAVANCCSCAREGGDEETQNDEYDSFFERVGWIDVYSGGGGGGRSDGGSARHCYRSVV